ncbi:hypothetical protein IX51_09470 [uncultured archaeon]|nr:hypothetical protein IX51_09470 [uncultured archaeon]
MAPFSKRRKTIFLDMQIMLIFILKLQLYLRALQGYIHLWMVNRTIIGLEHSMINIIDKNRYIKSMRKVVFRNMEVSS